MSIIQGKDLNFHYITNYQPIFERLTFSIETTWKTGVVAKNGGGKSTLLKLIHREISPTNGELVIPCQTVCYPLKIENKRDVTLNVIKHCLGLLELQQTIQDYEKNQVSESDYIDALTTYIEKGGYELDYKLEMECAKLNVTTDCLHRPYDSLSGGEQTKIQMMTLFLQEEAFVLLDEPTNHLDQHGITLLAHYLNQKTGFIVVSHHRAFLDACCDHMLYLNKGTIHIEQGNYETFANNLRLKREGEVKAREKIEKEVRQLEIAARKRRTWSERKEKEKIGAGDKGRIGHLAAKTMKRAKCIEKRVNDQLEEKKELIQYMEKDQYIKFNQEKIAFRVLDVVHLSISYDEKRIIHDLNFTLDPGECLVIKGPNGCGKSTLIKALRQQLMSYEGTIRFDNRVKVAYAGQHPTYTNGMLKSHLQDLNYDETRFRGILGTLGCSREIFERDLSTFSLGELKKVDLALSLMHPSTLLIWDEPLNGLDIASREAIEAAILKEQPTMIIVEHDETFTNHVATKILDLPVLNES